MNKKGIDISRWQGKPDFAKLKGLVDYVIVQAGFGRYSSQTDAEFERNYSECRKHGIPVGAYWFSYASTPDEARLEARACLEVLSGRQFEYPVYFDIEGSACSGDVSGKCRAFCSKLEKAGWFAGIYISRSPAQQYLSADVCKNYALWLAEYGGKLNWSGAVGMWQNSDSGRFPGISGNVDTDICYEDYPALIKAGGFNGFPKTSAKPLDDVVWYKKGDKDRDGGHGIFCIKQRLKAIGYKVDETGGFGDGTEHAVKDLQRIWGYKQDGVIGPEFVKILMK